VGEPVQEVTAAGPEQPGCQEAASPPSGATLSEYDFDLPEGLIAQAPAEPRDASRLLVLRRATGEVEHRVFTDLPGLLSPGDLLVMNDTRVTPARLVGHRERTRGKWEGLFVRENPGGLWELLSQTRGHLQAGEAVIVPSPRGGEPLRLLLVMKVPGGRWLVRAEREGSAPEVLARYGRVPIPPYIRGGRAEDGDAVAYQTVYARHEGAVAAPTAGLHFTERIFASLESRGVERALVTLHVGPGTFQPVKCDDVRDHRVEPEWGQVPREAADALQRCRARGGRVVAVGTTTTRLLEQSGGAEWSGLAGLTITPPFVFRAVEALLTNFHLPRSSLLLLVAAFAGRERVLEAYREAVSRGYRFYSYGDAMLIL
jgi:S-adenosylmethionine:tRNA ribosyltransferase-isomerase